jgi:hypothetical protein
MILLRSRKSVHIHIETRVPWLDIDDDLPQHVGHP